MDHPDPPYFDPDCLEHLSVYQIGWLDELHRKCCLKMIQGANGCAYITRVKRDEFGNPLLDGEVSNNSHVNVNIKYEKEVKFSLGVALVQKDAIDGICTKIVGIRIPLFEYTEQTIITDRDYRDKMDEAVRLSNRQLTMNEARLRT